MKTLIPYLLFVILGLMTGFVGGRVGRAENPAPPPWLTSLSNGWVTVSNSADYSQPPRKYQIGIFRDDSNGNLVYVSETGSIAVVHPTKMPAGNTASAMTPAK